MEPKRKRVKFDKVFHGSFILIRLGSFEVMHLNEGGVWWEGFWR
jgi:hypothetical protein